MFSEISGGENLLPKMYHSMLASIIASEKCNVRLYLASIVSSENVTLDFLESFTVVAEKANAEKRLHPLRAVNGPILTVNIDIHCELDSIGGQHD